MRNQNNYQGGLPGKKDFKADPFKQYLTVRGTSCAYAKDLCVAGKIKLEDIQEWTDRFTVLQFGKLNVDHKVTAEVMRIGTRLLQKVREREGTFDEFDKQNPVEEDKDAPATNQNAEFDIERERQLYEQEQAETATQQKAESTTTSADSKTSPPRGYYYNADTNLYHCEGCPKSYKTESAAIKHVANKHTTQNYGDHR